MKIFSIILFTLFTFYCKGQVDTVFNQTDDNNMKQGYWKKAWPNGKLMYRTFFKDDRPVGEMIRYYESGRIKAVMNYDDKGEYARTRMYYENGNLAAEGNFFLALKDSVWTYYSYYSKAVTSRESYDRGLRNGMMLNYFDNGDISEKIEWNNNQKTGIWEQYFKGNILKLKARFADNKLQGEFVVYTVSGNPYITGNYIDNLREGKWTFYSPDGSVQKVLNYRQGIAAEAETLDAEQQEFFRNIDIAQGKFKEPDETDFLAPSSR